MPKAKAASAAPTLAPEKSVPILEGLIAKADQLQSERWNSVTRKEWAHTAEGALIAALGGEHPAIDAFGGAQCGVYGPRDTDQKLLQQANRQLASMVAVLKSAVEQLRWQLPDPAQVFLPAGSAHDAYVEIRKIIQSAGSEIVVVDSYVDGTLWTLLTNAPPQVRIRILTMQIKGDFALEAHKFAAQHGNAVEVRQTSDYHDRFVVTDDKRCWHLGSSIKDAGNRAFAMSEIASRAIGDAIRADIEATWKAAKIIPI